MPLVRDATRHDRAELIAVRDTPTLHDQYLAEADGEGLRYLVYERGGRIVGFALLILRRLTSGVPPTDLPKISDLHIATANRSKGYGADFIARMEAIAREWGHDRMYIGVDPIENPRALELYRRLGYSPLQTTPYLKVAMLDDGHGKVEQRSYWRVDLMKALSG